MSKEIDYAAREARFMLFLVALGVAVYCYHWRHLGAAWSVSLGAAWAALIAAEGRAIDRLQAWRRSRRIHG